MIVGLCGLAQSGKDTAANHLVNHHGYRRIAFADPMRTALYALDPIVAIGRLEAATMRLRQLVDLRGWDDAKQNPDVRRLLQRFGTEVGRNQFGEDFWVNQATRGIDPGDHVVFTDVRFPNEADAVRRLGGIVIEIVRPGGGLAGHVGAHQSEAMDFTRDRTVVNDGTIDELHRALEVAACGQAPATAA